MEDEGGARTAAVPCELGGGGCVPAFGAVGAPWPLGGPGSIGPPGGIESPAGGDIEGVVSKAAGVVVPPCLGAISRNYCVI